MDSRYPTVEPLEFRRLLSITVANASVDLLTPGGILPSHAVRIAYLIPSNRTAQADGVANIRTAVTWYRDWFRDQMERNGFGSKTFGLETLADGATPEVHILPLPQTDAYYRADPWGRVQADASAAGLSLFGAGESWALFYEGHVQTPDGHIDGGSAGAYGPGSGSAGGVAVLGSDMIELIQSKYLTDERPYAGLTLPVLGPYPLAADAFIGSEGATLSSVASSRIGAVAHEMAHTFGLAHGYRNDENFHGNLLGNGLRGFRGNLLPEKYPSDWTRLEYADALAMSTNRFFNAGGTFTDNTAPAIGTFTGGAVMNGSLQLSFTATDAGGLSAALLGDDNGILDQLQLSGTSDGGAFSIPNYTPQTGNHFYLFLYDQQGNRIEYQQTIGAGEDETSNRAPFPFMKLLPETITAGQAFELNAANSYDPDDNFATLKFDWDLNSDGVFETSAGSQGSFWTSISTAGTRLIQLRVTDPHGASSVSAPIGIRVVPAPAQLASVSGKVFNDLDGDGTKDANESPLVGWRVYLDTDKDGAWDASEKSVLTNSVGNYAFNGLAAGAYRVREVLPQGWRIVRPSGGFRDHTLAAGAKLIGQDFATTQRALITGTLYNDANANGLRDKGEGALAGWTVFLDANKNGALDVGERTTTTDAVGFYAFKDLTAGSCRVRQVLKSGWRRTNPSWGYYDLNPAGGATPSNKDFGVTQRVLVSGTVFRDLNGDRIKNSGESGLSGWRVYLDVNGDGAWQAGERNILTDSSGKWTFADLLAGTAYKIRVAQQTGWKLTSPTTGYHSVTIASGATSTGRLFSEVKL